MLRLIPPRPLTSRVPLSFPSHSWTRPYRRCYASSQPERPHPPNPDVSDSPPTLSEPLEGQTTTDVHGKEEKPRAESPQARLGIDISDYDLNQVKERLRTLSERTAGELRQRVDAWTAQAGSRFSQLGGELNRVTGYEEINALKRRVVDQETRIERARQAARQAKDAYDTAVRQRANSQREVNDLLQRKSSWTDDDVHRFTALVRQDHLHEQDEARAKATASQTEDAVEREFSELMRVILNRYHEEQVWSDKIRSASTYGSLAVLGLNVVVFVLATLLVEPWKRKRLTRTFEKKVEEMSATNIAAFEDRTRELVEKLEAQDKILAQVAEVAFYTTQISDKLSFDEHAIQSPQIEAASVLSPTTNGRELAMVVVTTATAAGFLGWIARSWLG